MNDTIKLVVITLAMVCIASGSIQLIRRWEDESIPRRNIWRDCWNVYRLNRDNGRSVRSALKMVWLTWKGRGE